MAKLTTTYNELKELGACKEGLEMLWAWLCKTNHVRGDDPIDASIMRNQFITPADILESNGVGFLNWVLARTPRWESSFYSWGGRWEGSFAWAKEVSGRVEPTKTLAKDLKGGDKFKINGIDWSRTVQTISHDGRLGTSKENAPHKYLEYLYPETLDAIGFTLIEPKREPRRLKAEQILVKENVGTKWRGTQGFSAVAEVRDCGYGVLRLEFIKTNEPAYVTSNTVAVWEEVIE